MGLLDRGPPRRLLAAGVAEGRAGVFLGALCSVAHREFSGISHIRFSMGVSAKVAALHTVERDPIARAHVRTLRCRRSGAQPDNAFDFANGFIGSAVTRASIIDPGRKYHGRRHRFSVVGHKTSPESLKLTSWSFWETLRTSQQILMPHTLLTIFSEASLAHRLADGERS